MKKLLIKLLLGKKKKGFCDIVSVNGKPYMVEVYPYEPANEFIERMEKALHGQGLKC